MTASEARSEANPSKAECGSEARSEAKPSGAHRESEAGLAGSGDVLGIDHVYFAVRDLARSERFYDALLVAALGHVKVHTPIGGEPHVHYVNRHFSVALRPARSTMAHDAYAAGLHHFCFRVADAAAVDRVAKSLNAAGIAVSEPRLYPEYAPDYYATFVSDPDGLRLEVTNFRTERKERLAHWDAWADSRR